MNTMVKIPKPVNEPVQSYMPGTAQRKALKEQLQKMLGDRMDIPLIIGGREVRTGDMGECRCPHDHAHLLARYHKAGPREVEMAAASAREAWREWSEMDWVSRASIFLRAAELLSTKYRFILNGATMLGQSKTAHQAEIDAVCELADFYRFNPGFMAKIFSMQPDSAAGTWNYMDYRPLDGFVFAVTPFNFTAIAGNLPAAPAMTGNVVLWKPASSAVYSAYFLTRLWAEAGLPAGVINFIPGDSAKIAAPVLDQTDLAGVHFTGSTAVFSSIWNHIGSRIGTYRNYPRLVGETGGKDFVFVHATADVEATVTALIRGAFEYQGQKCSAASRAYIPKSLWPAIKERLLDEIDSIKVGDVTDFSNFMGAVIDRVAFDSIAGYLEYAAKSPDAEVLIGGGCDDSKGYFIEPTVVLTGNPRFKLMEEEIFGPVLCVYVYADEDLGDALELCRNTSGYALTGCVMANDRAAVVRASAVLRHAAGNFYINDKPTGAVVGQQPFGGGGASGTNDKSGSPLNLLRWVSARTIKENLNPPTDYRYAFLAEK